jgi:hypothetical protein
MEQPRPSTHQKALQINLDTAKYGAFAEIGAGQEVARWFFHVGHAAGTVAKTISAYDMTVSDAIYGHSDRYVSRQRLESMLECEYKLLLERLDEKRGAQSTFFVFADTVATRSQSRHQDGRGWLGVRFQTEPRGAPSEIIIHVRMRDTVQAFERDALGIVGVNLVHAAFYYHHDPAALLASLLDDLSRERIEVEMIKLSGPAFASVDNRLMTLRLVSEGFTDAAMFTADGDTVQPSDVLYQKPILVERGSFRPITNLTLDLLECAQAQFLKAPELQSEEPVVLMEMTLHNLTSGSTIDPQDFLARASVLHALGKTVLISNFGRYFRLAEYLSGFTKKMIALAVGLPSLTELIQEKYYDDLQGGGLEAAGRLFKRNVRMYVYPYRDPATGEVTSVDALPVPPAIQHLCNYLLENRFLEPIRNYDPNCLSILTTDVLAKIQSGDAAWEGLVPPAIVRAIKADKLFGWRPAAG